MNDDDLRRIYRASRKDVAESEAPRLEEMQALVENKVSGTLREELLDRALKNPSSMRELALLSSVAATQPAPSPLWRRASIVLAAAAAVLIFVMPRTRESTPSTELTFRSTTAQGVQIISPKPDMAFTKSTGITWRSVSGADQYTIEMIADDGSIVSSVSTTDTTSNGPSISEADLKRARGWQVVAHLRDGSKRQSEMRLLRRTP